VEAIAIREYGGADVPNLEEVTLPSLARGEALVRLGAPGINFKEIRERLPGSTAPHLPYVPVMEGAGLVKAVGDGADRSLVGRRIGYVLLRRVSYASRSVVEADALIPLPETVSEVDAATMLVNNRWPTFRCITASLAPVRPSSFTPRQGG